MYFEILLFVLGVTFGSFFAALSWRYPRRISISKGRSFCPHCKQPIKWFDNIPLLSYVLLLGKCRACQRKISWRYPLIELSMGIGFLLIWISGGSYIDIFYNLVVFVLLTLVFVIDIEHQIIPDGLVYSLMGVAFIKLLLTDNPEIYKAIFAGLLCALFLLILHFVTKGNGMGLGDVKFVIFGGMFVGFSMAFVWMLLAFLTGAIVGIILILTGKAGLKAHVAFGPFLVLSIYLTLLLGKEVISFLSNGL